MLNVPIKEMMESRVITVQQDSLLSEVEEKMRKHGIRHLPVVDREGRLMGLFTQRDLYRILPSRLKEEDPIDQEILRRHTLRDVMHKVPESLSPEESISKAVSLMWDKKYGCVPVVDTENKVVGIITAMDILHFAVHFLK
ncbi:MAG TPA: CBS domain-containing protein [Candidatus Omnitrophota bacterium]|nr:CBS domain-containing protein [Candidatus Omnitrophota bacterium]